jgi:F0F1-type ATP synthase assembly protein I
MRKALISLLAIQAIVIVAIAAGFYLYSGQVLAAAAALYGGGVTLVVSVLLAWRMSRAARPGAGFAGLYIGALERMVFVVRRLHWFQALLGAKSHIMWPPVRCAGVF